MHKKLISQIGQKYAVLDKRYFNFFFNLVNVNQKEISCYLFDLIFVATVILILHMTKINLQDLNKIKILFNKEQFLYKETISQTNFGTGRQ